MPLPNLSRLSPAPRPFAATTAFSLAAIACLLLPTLAHPQDAVNVVPTVSLSGPTYTLGNHPYEVTITFSESVTGFEQGDVTVGNASVSAFSGSGASYSITITPSASGAVTVDVAADVATDSNGNGNSAATQYSATADLDPPSINIYGPPHGSVRTGPFRMTIKFSEPVGVHGHPFEKGDVTVGNGSVTAFGGSGASYAIRITPSASGTVTVQVAAGVTRDAGGNANTASTQFSVKVKLNSPPVITAPGDKTYDQGQTITTFGIPVTDPDGDGLGITMWGLPSGLTWSWDNATESIQVGGTVSSTATAQAYTVTVEVNEVNAQDTPVRATYTITVTDPNAIPSRTIHTPSDQTYEQGETITAITVKVLPHSPQGVGETVTGLPSGLSFTQGTPGEISGTVAADAAPGAYTVTITSDEGEEYEATSTFTITVTASTPPTISPPVITNPGDKTYVQGEAIAPFRLVVSNPHGRKVSVEDSGLPSGLKLTLDWDFDPETDASPLLVNGTVAADAEVKDYTVTITADDGVNAAVTATFTVTVTAPPPTNSPPEISVPGNKTYRQGETITAIDFKVTDVDGDEVTLTVSGLPAGLAYTNALLQGTVSASATAQNYTVTVSASDGVNATVTATFTITVTASSPPAVNPPVRNPPPTNPPANSPPVITAPGDKTYQQGQTITAFGIPVIDPDGEGMGITMWGMPSGLSWSWDEETDSIQVTGTVSASATTQAYTVTVSANEVNAQDAAVTATYTITVIAPNSPPEIRKPHGVYAIQYQKIWPFDIRVDDPDGDAVTVTVTGLPPGLSYSSSTGQVSGTPMADEPRIPALRDRTFTMTITADDGVNPR